MTTLYFKQPYVVQPSAPDAGGFSPNISVVMHGLHTLGINISAGQASFRFFELEPLIMFASTNGAGKTAFYSSAATALDMDVTLGPPAEVFFFYDLNAPALAFISAVNGGGGIPASATIATCLHPGDPGDAQNISPAESPVGNSGNRGGGYLGLDAGKKLCWALPTSDAWSASTSLWSLPEIDAAGGTATLTCQRTAAAPAPASGDTYASGCPSVTEDATVTLSLVAH